MTPAEFRAFGIKLYGKRGWRGWQAKMARALSTTEATVSRWASGQNKISTVAARAIRSLEAEK